MTRFARSAVMLMTAALLGAAVAAAPVSPAAAHTPSVSASCSTLAVSLKSYVSTQSNPKPNRVTVTVDGAVLAAEAFGASFSRDFTLGDPAKPHAWRVAVDAVDNGYDRVFDGTSIPCAPVAAKDAAASLQTTPPTCAAAATLVLNPPVNARWSTPSATTGPAAFSVTATADRGHVFDDGKPTRVFTGTLAGALPPSAPECAAPPVVTPPTTTTPPRVTPPRATPPRAAPKPAPLEMSSQSVTLSCDDRMLVTTTTRSVIDWVPTASGGWVEAAPVVTTARSTERINPGDCPGEIAGGGGGDGTGSGLGLGGSAAPVLAAAAGGGAGLAGAVVDALAHAGADIAVAVCLAISLLAAGGIILLRRRQGVGGLAE